jgi:hypothetical protein
MFWNCIMKLKWTNSNVTIVYLEPHPYCQYQLLLLYIWPILFESWVLVEPYDNFCFTNILCKMFAIIAYFIISLFARLYVKVDIYLTCGKTDHHDIARNACTKSGSLRFSQFFDCWLILSVYIIMSFDFPFVRLFGVR